MSKEARPDAEARRLGARAKTVTRRRLLEAQQEAISAHRRLDDYVEMVDIFQDEGHRVGCYYVFRALALTFYVCIPRHHALKLATNSTYDTEVIDLLINAGARAADVHAAALFDRACFTGPLALAGAWSYVIGSVVGGVLGAKLFGWMIGRKTYDTVCSWICAEGPK